MRKNKFLILFLLMVIALVVLVTAAPSFHTSGTTSYLQEDQSSVFEYNFTANVTNSANETLIFEFVNITSTTLSSNSSEDYSWIVIDSSTGVMTINSTRDNETGMFNISVFVHNPAGQGQSDLFYFFVNTSNDAPNFTTIQAEYNLTQDENFLNYLNASDEEEHYPLFFNISFNSSCSYANWSDRSNCSLISLSGVDNLSALMNLTPARNDVGTYYANISVVDFGENATCPNNHCLSNYVGNKTTYYSKMVTFNVFSTLIINVTDCQNSIFNENVSNTCRINVTTKGSDNSLNISSLAVFRNSDASVSNSSWFYSLNQTSAEEFAMTAYINATPGKTEVGNWTINFTVLDLTSGQTATEQIYIIVNRTYNDAPELLSVSNLETSINLLTTINLTVYDDDLLILDKNSSLGGFNETLNFTLDILNQTNLSQELSLTSFDVEILNMPVSGTNRTEAKIEFTPNSSEVGNYTINLTVTDYENSTDAQLFNLSIISNNYPQWNTTLTTIFIIYENNITSFNISQNVSDPDGTILTFSYTNDTNFPNFTLNSSTGIINLTPVDQDVGQHLVTIIASDGYLTNSTVFNFTIYSVNDLPAMQLPLTVTNATVDSSSNMTGIEDNVTIIVLQIEDDDFKIPSNQGIYNESLSINLTIEGPNTALFEFTRDYDFPTPGNNVSRYEAEFTPNKTDVGFYNITLNITDYSNASSFLHFNITLSAVEHDPILMNLTNYSSAINRSFYYRINITDTEDGSSNVTGNTNFTFSYNFIAGSDFIYSNDSIFNSTTGELNITFNSSQGGKYHINVSANDSAGRFDSGNFWINVYDIPVVNFPASTFNFNLIENQSSDLIFQVNHSVGDNLTYEFYIDDVSYNGSNYLYGNLSLRNTSNYYGNNTNLTWSFVPNFTDETYGNVKNLTLIVYPLSSNIANSSDLNKTISWNITINHTNSPVVFSGYIGDKQSVYTSDIDINLENYFSDIDNSDLNYSQTINYSVSSNATPSYISYSVSGTTLSLSSLIATTELLNISASDLESNASLTNVTSNNFVVDFTAPVTVTTPTSGGGGGVTPIAFKLIVPNDVSVYVNETIEIPLSLVNRGSSRSFSQINVTSQPYENGSITKKVRASFDRHYFSYLASGDVENFTLTLSFDTQEEGEYEVFINATSKSPKYSDWAQVHISLQKLNESEIRKLLVFTEELIVKNPDCIEIREMVEVAKEFFKKGDFANAKSKAEEAIEACRASIGQMGLASISPAIPFGMNEYLVITIIISIVLGVSYYYFKRIKLSKIVKPKSESVMGLKYLNGV